MWGRPPSAVRSSNARQRFTLQRLDAISVELRSTWTGRGARPHTGKVPTQARQTFRIGLGGLYRTIRCGGGRRRPCRLRGRHGRRAHGPEDRPLHAQCRPHRADVLQPRSRRHRQGTPGPRSRCPRRNHGRDHRRGRHPVSPAEYLARPGRLVATRPVRQTGLSPEDARGSGITAQSQNQASGSRGADRGKRSGPRGDSRPRLSGRAEARQRASAAASACATAAPSAPPPSSSPPAPFSTD